MINKEYKIRKLKTQPALRKFFTSLFLIKHSLFLIYNV